MEQQTSTSYSNPHHSGGGENALVCNEDIRGAPSAEWCPESVPGAWNVNKQHEVLFPGKKSKSFNVDLEPEDLKLVNELGRLQPDQLHEYIKTLQSTAFSLGVEEARQFSKGKVLQIFKKRSDLQ